MSNVIPLCCCGIVTMNECFICALLLIFPTNITSLCYGIVIISECSIFAFQLVFHTTIRPHYLSIVHSKEIKRILNVGQRTGHAPSSMPATTYMGAKTREQTYCLLPCLFPHSELLPGAPLAPTVGSPLPWPSAERLGWQGAPPLESSGSRCSPRTQTPRRNVHQWNPNMSANQTPLFTSMPNKSGHTQTHNHCRAPSISPAVGISGNVKTNLPPIVCYRKQQRDGIINDRTV